VADGPSISISSDEWLLRFATISVRHCEARSAAQNQAKLNVLSKALARL
jgi:hypothetical protein